jgi:hypothetical protein
MVAWRIDYAHAHKYAVNCVICGSSGGVALPGVAAYYFGLACGFLDAHGFALVIKPLKDLLCLLK